MHYHEYVYKMLAKHAPRDFFKIIVELPVFRFSDTDFTYLSNDPKDIAPWREIVKLMDTGAYLDLVPFKELAVVFDEAFMAFVFGYSSKKAGKVGIKVLQFPLKEDFSRGDNWQSYCCIETFIHEFNCEGVSEDGTHLPQMLSNATLIRYKNHNADVSYEDRIPDDQLAFQGQSLVNVIGLFCQAESKHMIKVERKKRPESSKPQRSRHEWKSKVPTTHYIYLDAPPAGSAGCNTGTGKPLTTGHRRRAHWRVLRAERFKKHPNYMKQIRIREAWIGPKTWSDSGAVYTVMDEETDD